MQLEKMLPIVCYIAKTENVKTVEAWSLGIKRTAGRNRKNFPIHELLKALVPFAGWAMSTSGVEQNFSIRDWINAPRQQCSPRVELDHLIIATHDCPEEEDLIFKNAMKVWNENFGHVRGHGAQPSRMRGSTRTHTFSRC